MSTLTPSPQPVLSARAGWLSLIAVTLGALMPGLATTILAVANGAIATDLKIGLGDLQWITSAYLLGLTGSLVLAGKLGDRFGRKRIFLIGIAGFGLTSLLIGFATPVVLIVVLRAVQGVFGGFLTTNALSLLRANVPERRLPTAIGIFNSVQGLSIAAGPILGGLIVQYLGWRWTMFVNVPIAVVCLILGLVLLREVKIPTTGRFDYAGTVLLIVALTALVYALIDAPTGGWGAPSTLVLFAVAVVSFVGFLLVERRAADPLVPLALFRDRSFAAGSVLSVLAFFALNGGLFLISLFWLQIQHVPATTVGVWLLPLGIAMLVSAILSGRVIGRIGDRWALMIGSLLLAAGLACMSFARVEGGYLPVAAGLALVGLGLGLLVTATVNATVGNAPVELAGPAAGVQQTASRFGAALGVAVLGGIMAASTAAAFGAKLDASGLPDALTAPMKKLGSTAVAGGVAPIPPGSSRVVADLITNLTDAAFLAGMSTTMLIAAGICIVGALVGLLVRPRAIHEEDAELVEAEHPFITD
ncbi:MULTISPECIES: MFS transporter [unclassified Microbacterium]|uniref:MFS transporter n=1 Tax=unclassified Microbacterium TaxID=2609290 RepID=UPI00365A86EC